MPGEYFTLKPVDVDTVILTANNLNNTNSVGTDRIPLRFLKDVFIICHGIFI